MAMHEELRLRISADLLERLRAYAEERRVPVATVVRMALEARLEEPASSPEDAPNPPTRREGTTRAAKPHPWRKHRASVAPSHSLRSREG